MTRWSSVAAGLAAVMLFGCAEQARYGSVVLQVATRSPQAAPGAPSLILAGDSALVALEPDTIVIRRVRAVVRMLALQPAQSGECDEDEDEACADLEPGLMLLDLPLVRGAESVLQVPVASSSYAVFQVQVHAADPTADADFVADHPDLAEDAVRIEGAFSRSGARQDFVLTSRLNEIQELVLQPPLDVHEGDTLHVTLRVDLSRVFVTNEGALLDPTSAGPGSPSEHLVRDNIRLSLAAFRDENQDGLDDAHEMSHSH